MSDGGFIGCSTHEALGDVLTGCPQPFVTFQKQFARTICFLVVWLFCRKVGIVLENGPFHLYWFREHWIKIDLGYTPENRRPQKNYSNIIQN